MSQAVDEAKVLFLRALEFDRAGERAAFLDAACAGQAELRLEVERLMAAHQELGAFHPQARAATLPEITERPGNVVGHYKLLQQIGEGGFGVVFMAEQTEPIRRNVALKIIKPGMDTRQIVARFEAERQALALMDHPNIAKVLDAGSTESGRPYFVMELVKGIPVTEYCDRYNLTLRERLELFATVCHAVQHAHHKGVIHRDIKPSNVMVTLHDGRPVPKVIDFGVSKAINQRLTERTLFTNFAQMVGTPLYMSPEQAELSGLDIDTRSDVYSLGVLLYELLTGTTPFDGARLKQAAFDEIRRIIREEEPPRPSTRISTLGETLPGVAAHRRTEPKKLSVLMRGELDWIVMKALEKDRTRRYDTANGFAADVRRYLNDEPVQACPPSAGYRFRKFARRNAAVFTTAAIVAVALIAGTVASTWQAIRATRAEALAESRVGAVENARRQAQTNFEEATRQGELAKRKEAEARIEAAKAKATADLLQEMLGSADPSTAKGPDYSVRQLLDDFSLRFGDQLKGQPEVEASIRATVGGAYTHLGLPLSAEPHLQRALEARREIFGREHPAVAQSLLQLSKNLRNQGRYAEGYAMAREAVAIYQAVNASPELRISGLYYLILFVKATDNAEVAQAILEEALALAERLPARESPELASILHNAARWKVEYEEYEEGERLARQAVAMHRRLRPERHPETGWALRTLGYALNCREKYAEAEAAYREAIAIFQESLSMSHSVIATTYRDLADVMAEQGKELEAVARERLAQATQRAQRSPDDGHAWLQRAHVQATLGHWEELILSFEAAAQLGKTAVAESNYQLAAGWSRLAGILRDRKSWDQADRVFGYAISLRKPLDAASLPEIRLAQANDILERARVQVELGHWDNAVRSVDASAELGKAVDAESNYKLADGWSQVATTLRLNHKKPAQAERALRHAIALREPLDADSSPRARLMQSNEYIGLAWVSQSQRRMADAEASFREAIKMRQALAADFPAEPSYRRHLAYGYWVLEPFLRSASRLSEAEEALEEAGRHWHQVAERPDLTEDFRQGIANDLNMLGDRLRMHGFNPQAEAAYRKAIHLFEQLPLTNSLNMDSWITPSLRGLGMVLRDRGKLAEAEAAFRRVVESRIKWWGKEDLGSVSAVLELAYTLLLQERFAEAEPLAREVVRMRDMKMPNYWTTFNARSILGGILLGQKKYAEAEPLLISGYEGMASRQSAIAAYDEGRVTEALVRLVQLYEATGRSEKAAEWNAKLAAWNAEQAKRDSKATADETPPE